MTFIEEAVIGGFIGKIVSDCIDVSWSKIKEADKNRKSKNQNLQTRIYQVIVDAINEATYNKYKGQDALYDAAESLLNGLKSGSNNRIEVVKHGLSTLISDVDNDKGVEFIGILRTEISKECNFDLYKEILIMLLGQTTEYNHVQLRQIEEQLDYIIQRLGENTKPQENNTHYKVKSRTQEYADKWNNNMFLNNFNKRDKNVGANVKLKDVYLESHLPHYIWGDRADNIFTDLKDLLSEYTDESYDNKMLLILGQPGIGKSTLITWITANFANKLDDIMVYQFASDLKNINWQKSNISYEILDALNLSYNDLNGKTLILDGFDEVSVGGNRKDILDQLYGDLIYKRNIYNFKLIVTCRENYIQRFERIKCRYITLQPWDEEQIHSFCVIFQRKAKCDILEHTIAKVIESKEILGIPLILYMVLALNISIDQEESIVDIYDKIFSLVGGIYDRCIESKNFADDHKIVGQIKKQIHQISREIAIWIFENNPHAVFIPEKEYEKICDNVIKAQAKENEFIKQGFLIGNFFKLRYCEGVGTEEIYFVHRSIYEYFVADAIYSVIKNALLELSEESKKELAGNIAFFLKKGRITFAIGRYLLHKILNVYYKLDGGKQEKFYQWWEETVDMMMAHGMFFFTGNNIQNYENILKKETNCFVNIVTMLRLLLKTSKREFIMQNISTKQLEMYVKLTLLDYKERLTQGLGVLELSTMCLTGTDFSKANLRGVNLDAADLRGVNLLGANLRDVNLVGTNLSRADLRGANLIDADLFGANLAEANLSRANLSRADLRGADLSRANLYKANLYKADLDGTIWDDSNLKNILPRLKKADFNTLRIINGNGVKQVFRSELFLDENSFLDV